MVSVVPSSLHSASLWLKQKLHFLPGRPFVWYRHMSTTALREFLLSQYHKITVSLLYFALCRKGFEITTVMNQWAKKVAKSLSVNILISLFSEGNCFYIWLHDIWIMNKPISMLLQTVQLCRVLTVEYVFFTARGLSFKTWQRREVSCDEVCFILLVNIHHCRWKSVWLIQAETFMDDVITFCSCYIYTQCSQLPFSLFNV